MSPRKRRMLVIKAHLRPPPPGYPNRNFKGSSMNDALCCHKGDDCVAQHIRNKLLEAVPPDCMHSAIFISDALWQQLQSLHINRQRDVIIGVDNNVGTSVATRYRWHHADGTRSTFLIDLSKLNGMSRDTPADPAFLARRQAQRHRFAPKRLQIVARKLLKKFDLNEEQLRTEASFDSFHG